MAEDGRRISLQMKMLIGFIVGLTLGLIAHMTSPDAPWVEAITTYVTGPIGQIFLRLLFMLVTPLLFSALVVGIEEMGDIRSRQRVGLKTMISLVHIHTTPASIAIVWVTLYH